MRPLLLCRERLERINRVLGRSDGSMSIRDLGRSHGILKWEVEQAAAMGWLEIQERKPATGRPSLLVKKISESASAKLPPWRSQIPVEISIRHWRFAIESVGIMPCRGLFGFKLATQVHAYHRAFPEAFSRAGASASASRLMKRKDVLLMRLWLRSSISGRMPETTGGLIADLVRVQADASRQRTRNY